MLLFRYHPNETSDRHSKIYKTYWVRWSVCHSILSSIRITIFFLCLSPQAHWIESTVHNTLFNSLIRLKKGEVGTRREDLREKWCGKLKRVWETKWDKWPISCSDQSVLVVFMWLDKRPCLSVPSRIISLSKLILSGKHYGCHCFCPTIQITQPMLWGLWLMCHTTSSPFLFSNFWWQPSAAALPRKFYYCRPQTIHADV